MAVLAIPAWMTGRSVTVFTIAPLSILGTGIFTVGTAASLSGKWSQCSLNLEHVTVQKAAADQYHDSNLIVGRRGTIEIEELEQLYPLGVGTTVNECLNSIVNAGYVQIVCTRAVVNVGDIKTWKGYGTLMSGGETLSREDANGKLTIELTAAFSTDTGVTTDVTEQYVLAT